MLHMNAVCHAIESHIHSNWRQERLVLSIGSSGVFPQSNVGSAASVGMLSVDNDRISGHIHLDVSRRDYIE